MSGLFEICRRAGLVMAAAGAALMGMALPAIAQMPAPPAPPQGGRGIGQMNAAAAALQAVSASDLPGADPQRDLRVYLDERAAAGAATATKLYTSTASLCPFGLPCYPSEMRQSVSVRSVAAEDAVNLAKAVRRLSITAINPAKREILVGMRNLHEGDKLTLTYSGKVFHTRVDRISPNAAVFRDRDTGQVASAPITAQPPALGSAAQPDAGGSSIFPPGIEKAAPVDPLSY